MRSLFYLLILSLLAFGCQPDSAAPEKTGNWPGYQGGPDANQYSALDQINTENADQLMKAWEYASTGADTTGRTQIQCNPLVIDGTLYGTSPRLQVFALDAATGREKWKFNPAAEGNGALTGMGVNRGLAYWEEGEQKRLFFSSGPLLYALDAQSGKPDPAFGNNGHIDLHDGLDRPVDHLFINSNSPGRIYKDKLIMGSRVSESTGPVPGHIRAFNVRTGEMEWIFHTIPHPGEYGYDTWPKNAWLTSGGANAWSGFSVDEERGMVFAPTGSASFDFYGGDRPGDNLFANCILALDADTGEYIWHFQSVHHDLWDRDHPAPPNLVTVTHEGKQVDAVAQITKSGFVIVLDRETGEPLFPIEERPVPSSTLTGEVASPTQPYIIAPPPFSRQEVNEADLARRSPEVYAYAKEVWEEVQQLPVDPYTPPATTSTFIFPGFDGGGEWGGAATDPDGILYVNSSEMPWVIKMAPYEAPEDQRLATKGKQVYDVACIACHGPDLKGGATYGNAPSLLGLNSRLDQDAVVKVIQEGKGVMPSFSSLKAEELNALTAFLMESDELDESGSTLDLWPYPYRFNGYNRFYAPDGFPAITPPWGQLTAVDLNEGTIKWQVTLGDLPMARAESDPATGAQSYGGPVVTAGNVIFIAATEDEKFRVFDKRNGDLIWETGLPAAGYATPATYAVDGKQYVVVACGGGKLGTKSGDKYVAFALPN